MWSATWPTEIQALAREFLGDHVRVTVGSENLKVNPNVEQHFEFMDDRDKHAR